MIVLTINAGLRSHVLLKKSMGIWLLTLTVSGDSYQWVKTVKILIPKLQKSERVFKNSFGLCNKKDGGDAGNRTPDTTVMSRVL